MTVATSTDSLWRRLCYTRMRDVLRGRLDARLDWRQTIALAELPESLTDATRQVVGRTRLWRGEKVDVANDLIAHFQDGLAFGHSPDELLKSFGDARAAAQLIRRAKRRSRPLAWHVWHYGWMCLLVLVGTYIAMGLWMSMGRPMIRTDYLSAFNKAPLAVPENERAWPGYRDALLAMLHEDNSSPAMIAMATAKPGEADWPAAEQFLREHADSIAKLREAAGRRELGFVRSTSHADFSPMDRDLFGVSLTPEQIVAAKHEKVQDRWLLSALLPDLQSLQQSAWYVASDARRAALIRDGSTAYDDVVAMYGISRHCQETPFLVCLLTAAEVQQKAHSVIQDILAQYPDLWTDAQLRDLAHKLAASRIDWQRGFEGERASFYDSMQRIYTDNGHGDGRLALQVTNDQNVFQLLDSISSELEWTRSVSMFSNSGIAMFTLPVANMVVASRKEMTDLFDKVTNRARAKIETPLWKPTGETSLDDEIRALESEPLGKFRYLFVRLLVPSYDTLRYNVAASDGERDGIFVGLALELYHREHGKWPNSLDELSPRWIPTVPVDRINGGPLGYRIDDDRPLVYSFGVDGDDDRGRLPANCEGDATKYRVSEPYEIPAETTEHVRGWHDGDWVIWTTAKSE